MAFALTSSAFKEGEPIYLSPKNDPIPDIEVAQLQDINDDGEPVVQLERDDIVRWKSFMEVFLGKMLSRNNRLSLTL